MSQFKPTLTESVWRRFERTLAMKERFRRVRLGHITVGSFPQPLVKVDDKWVAGSYTHG